MVLKKELQGQMNVLARHGPIQLEGLISYKAGFREGVGVVWTSYFVLLFYYL